MFLNKIRRKGSCICSGDYYVSPGGSNSNPGTKADPFLTLNYAHSQISDGDIVCVKPGTYPENDGSYAWMESPLKGNWKSCGRPIVQPSAAQATLLRIGGTNTCSLKGFIFDCNNVSTKSFIVQGSGTTLTNCDFINTAAGVQNMQILGDVTLVNCYINDSTNPSRVIEVQSGMTIRDGRIVISSTPTLGVFYIAGAGLDPVRIISNTITLETDLILINYSATGSELHFINNTVNCAVSRTKDVFNLPANKTLTVFDVIGNTINLTGATSTNPMLAIDDHTVLSFESNTIRTTQENNTSIVTIFSAGNVVSPPELKTNTLGCENKEGYNFRIGPESTNAYDEDLDDTELSGNLIRSYNYYNTREDFGVHNIYVGFSKDAVIKYNMVDGGGLGIVCKSVGGDQLTYTAGGIWANVVKRCNQGIRLKSINAVNIINNTCIDNNYGIMVSDHEDDGADCENVVIKNNIVIDFDRTKTLINVDQTTALGSCDYNVYYSDNATPFLINGVAKTWVEWQAAGYDANSIFLTQAQALALFTDKDNDDYSLASGSEARKVGLYDANYKDLLDASTVFGEDPITVEESDPPNCGAFGGE